MVNATEFWREQNGIRHITPRGMDCPEGSWLDTAFDSVKGTVIEFGCGPGRLAKYFNAEDYLGVDINENAVLTARHRNPKHRFELTDTSARLGPVDTIICHTVMLHVPDDMLADTLARFDAKRVLVNEMLGRGWRRDGTPPVYNRDFNDYADAFWCAGFECAEFVTRTYEHYQAPMALMDFTRR